MLHQIGARALWAAGKEVLQRIHPFFCSGAIVGCQADKASVADWQALQLRLYGKGRGKAPHGPHVWLKMDREKWHKDLALDAVWEKEREMIYVMAMKDILANYPEMQMSLKVLGSYKRFIGLVGKNSRPAAWIQRYPAIFKVDGKMPFLEYLPSAAGSFFRFTDKAAEHVAKEKQFWLDNEQVLVDKVRKILMMAPERRMPLEVLGHLRKELGLSDDVRNKLICKYPEHLRLVESPRGFDLELVQWDAELAVSSFERAFLAPNAAHGGNFTDDDVNWLTFKNKSNLTRLHRNEIIRFHQAPFVSPYQEVPLDAKENSVEAERHAVAVLHELLSLSLRRRMTLDRLAHFRALSKYVKGTRSVIIQHPELFYISLKNARETVFLREAYRDSQFLIKDPFLEAQSWVSVLMEESRVARKLEQENAKRKKKETGANSKFGIDDVDDVEFGDETDDQLQSEQSEEEMDVEKAG